MTLIQELQKIGLSDKEAKVYLAALEQGQASVQQISEKAGVNRATSYFILDSLIKKGLMSTFEQGKKTLYVASSPETLESVFEIQKKELEERAKHFKSLLPDLHLIFNRQKDKPIVKFFEGKQGMFNCIQECMGDYKSEDEIRMIYNKDDLNRAFTDEDLAQYRESRIQKKIKSKVLYNYSEGELSSSPDGKRVKISESDFPVNCDIGIYGDCIRIATLGKKLSSILIRDKGVANTFRSIFDLAWKAAKKE